MSDKKRDLEKVIYTSDNVMEFLNHATYQELEDIAKRSYYLKMEIDRAKAKTQIEVINK